MLKPQQTGSQTTSAPTRKTPALQQAQRATYPTRVLQSSRMPQQLSFQFHR
jgi:hypothetical protein